jgi:antitoxin (DNA-binding transcriptional repressor) of toxin-antitoxin stability system
MKKNFQVGTEPPFGPLLANSTRSYAEIMARSVDINEVGSRLPELADCVLSGEEVLFSKNGKDFLQLVPVAGADTNYQGLGKVGLNLGCGIPFAPDFTWDQWEESEKEMENIWRQHGHLD